MKTNVEAQNVIVNPRPKFQRSFLNVCSELSALRTRRRHRELALPSLTGTATFISTYSR